MGIAASVLILTVVFAVGFVAGFAARALISVQHRYRLERTRDHPLEDN